HHRRRRGRFPCGSGSPMVDRLAGGGAGRRGARGRRRSAGRTRRDRAAGGLTAMPAPLRVIIADDHALFRQGLKAMLVKLHPDVNVVGEVDSVSEIGPALARTPCDILLLDLQLDRNALADIGGFARRVRVVVVTASQDPSEALAALRAGARAVVFKRFAVETLMEALRA